MAVPRWGVAIVFSELKSAGGCCYLKVDINKVYIKILIIMKITKLALAALALFMGAGAMSLSAQSPILIFSPGPAVAGSVDLSNLPEKARKYLVKHFGDVAVVSAEREYMAGRYDVELADGLELEFDNKGNIVEIDAPDGYVIGKEVIDDMLPVTAVNLLRSNNYLDFIDKIEKTKDGGYLVEVDNSGDIELEFNSMGEFMAVVTD